MMTHSPVSCTPHEPHLSGARIPQNAATSSAVFVQWEFRLGSAAAAGKTSGPLGGIGSGPKVEKMVEAMDSWNGLCLDYR